MSIVRGTDLTPKERSLLFWASFLALAAAGFGFSFRVALGHDGYGVEFSLTNLQIGMVFGATLWPIALTMIGFSLVVDRTGYKLPMFAAFALQATSGIGTFFSSSYESLYFFALCAGLGHGIVEAVINPVCAAVYPHEKTKRLTVLHAAWPFGLVFGTLAIIGTDWVVGGGGMSWQFHALWVLVPAVGYALMFLPCKFPVDERVQAGVPYMDMLKQVGFLSASLAAFLVIYEIGNQGNQLFGWDLGVNWFNWSLVIGLAVGLGFGAFVKSLGKPLFFCMCLLMIPVATAELGTDGWIKGLMTPVLEGNAINPALALVFSAFIMLVLRVFAGGILVFFTPPSLLALSGLLSALGLWWLSGATGVAVFVAFVIYALGQTYYWPCILGFVAERYPQGGALTLNTVSAMGLLSVGIIGGPLLGAAFDESIHDQVAVSAPALEMAATEDRSFLGMKHKAIIPEKQKAFIATLKPAEKVVVEAKVAAAGSQAGRDVLLYAVRFPAILVISFGLIFLYFRSRGGYRPVVLSADGDPS